MKKNKTKDCQWCNEPVPKGDVKYKHDERGTLYWHKTCYEEYKSKGDEVMSLLKKIGGR